MKKNLRLMLATVLMMFGMTALAQEMTLDFTTNDWGLPTDYSTEAGSFTNAAGYTVTFGAVTDGNGYKFNPTDKYVIYGKKGATITFSAFDFDVERIDITGRDAASGAVLQNLYVGDVAVSTETVGAKITNSYAIAEAYQAAGNVYVLKVNSSHNTQITKIEIFKKGEGGTGPVTPDLKPAEGGTVDQPLTVAQALSFIEQLGAYTSEEVYVAGYVTSIDEISTQHGNATFNIADAEGGTPVLKIYRAKGLENKGITDENFLKVGDKVVVCGKLKMYNTTPEMDQGGYVYSLNGKTTEGETPVDPVELEGDGTQANPFTVADVKAMNEADFPADKVWVKGFIVGTLSGKDKFNEEYVVSNFALASTATEETASNTVPVQLPTGAVREKLNLVDNPSNLGKAVKVFGNITIYFSTTGVKNVENYEIDGETNIIVMPTATEQGEIFNLQGQRVAQPTKGLYIIDGRKVMVK
jgi:RPA family protein